MLALAGSGAIADPEKFLLRGTMRARTFAIAGAPMWRDRQFSSRGATEHEK